MVRKPAVSGQFYPANPTELRLMVESMLAEVPVSQKETAIGAIVPHAGYIYSGPVAAAVFSRIKVPELVIMMGPNHTGIGQPFALMTNGIWEMPFGKVAISALAKDLLSRSTLLTDDNQAHLYEHSLEVQLPFLQVVASEPFEIIPIVIGSLDLENLLHLGVELAEFIPNCGKKTLILASSDMSHYEPDPIAREKDHYALEAIQALDPVELALRVTKSDISMCGVGPVTITLSAARELKAQKAEVVQYATSGETSGDYASVVGYAGVIIQ